MLLSINIIEDDLDSAAIDTYKRESILLMPEKMFNKLRIIKKILSRTLIN
jgi:hypothetical protein